MSELFNRLKKIEQDKKEDDTEANFDSASVPHPDEEGFPIEGEIKRQKAESRKRFKAGAVAGGAIFVIAILSFGIIKGRVQLGKTPKSATNPLKSEKKIPKPETKPAQLETKPAKANDNKTLDKASGEKNGTVIAPSSSQAVKPPVVEAKTEGGTGKPKEPLAQKREPANPPDTGKPAESLTETQISSQEEDTGLEVNYFEQAVGQYKESNMIAAVESIKKGLRQNPQAAVGYNNLGVIYFQQGDLNESLNQFNMAIQLNPQYAEAHYNLALTLEQLGRNQTALYHYLKFVELAPPQLNQLQEHVKAHIDIY